MPVMLIDLLFGLFVLAVGMGLGWWFRTRGGADGESPSEDTQQARQVLARLHELASRVAADVGAHSTRVEEINEGLNASDQKETSMVVDAVAQLIEANSRMQEQLGSAEKRLREQAELVESHAAAALTDALTGLANRRAFDEEMARQLQTYRTAGNVFSIVMLDVDHFKKFNDTYGHQAGDEVLRLMGELLRETARQRDIVARYGGEEFALILPGTDVCEASRGAERVRQAIASRRFHCEGLDLNVTSSLGAAAITEGEEVAALIQRSDAALYASKENGRNCVHWHDGRQIHPVENGNSAKKQTESPSDKRQQVRAQPASVPAKQPPKPSPCSGQTERAEEEPSDEALGLPGVGVPAMSNRTEFCIILARRLAEWRRGGATPSVLMIRIDNYAKLQEENGARVGGLIVKATSQFLNAAIRDMDLVAQYDAATFAVLFPGTWLANVIRVAERLREAIAKCSLPGKSGPLKFTVSSGGAKATESDDTKRLLERSFEALESATEAGGNCSLFHNGAWSETVAAAIEREAEIGHAAE